MFWLSFVGSNSHNNNSPAGDGQAGDAGEGKSGKSFVFILVFYTFLILHSDIDRKIVGKQLPD